MFPKQNVGGSNPSGDAMDIETERIILELEEYIVESLNNSTDLVLRYCMQPKDYASLNKPLSEAYHRIQHLKSNLNAI